MGRKRREEQARKRREALRMKGDAARSIAYLGQRDSERMEAIDIEKATRAINELREAGSEGQNWVTEHGTTCEQSTATLI